ncbi:MAG: hypothetical protein HC894_06005 [Microcoleus sp. SM1_3_4]|nr:hypothetical protein [Microcoleus sp. SM1_3_4]
MGNWELVRRTKQLFSSLFQSWCIDEETEKISRNPKFISIIDRARAQKGKGISSEEMRSWVETELSED